MSTRSLQPKACGHPRPDPLHLVKAPYRRTAATWSSALDDAMKAAKIGRAAREALRRMVERETAEGRTFDFTPHQVAAAGGCHARTIYRELPKLQAAALILPVTPGNRGTRQAAVYRFGVSMPEWGRVTKARQSIRVTKGPSPLELRSSEENKSPSCAPQPQANLRTAQSASAKGAHEGRFADRGRRAKPQEEPLKGSARILAQAMLEAGVDARGVRKAVRVAQVEERVREAVRAVKTTLAYIATRPLWVTPGREQGLLMAVVLDPARAAKIRRQLVHQRRLAKRSRSAPETLTPEPVGSVQAWEPQGPAFDLRKGQVRVQAEWAAHVIQEARQALQELPAAAQARIRTELAAEPQDPWFLERALVRAIAREAYTHRKVFPTNSNTARAGDESITGDVIKPVHPRELPTPASGISTADAPSGRLNDERLALRV